MSEKKSTWVVLRTGLMKSLPESYLAFLTRANGGEGFIRDRYVQLWRAEELAEMNRAYTTTEFFPNFFSSGAMAAEKPTRSISRARTRQYLRFHLLACRPTQGQSPVRSNCFWRPEIRVNECNRLFSPTVPYPVESAECSLLTS